MAYVFATLGRVRAENLFTKLMLYTLRLVNDQKPLRFVFQLGALPDTERLPFAFPFQR